MRKPEFVYVTYIETTPEKLWEALTSSEFTKRYWWDTLVISDWKVDSPLALEWRGKVTDTGVIVEADPPRRLSYTWSNTSEEFRNERPSRVTFVLDPYGKLVKLTLTHEDFEQDSKMLQGISKGWPAIMSSLKSMLESGQALDVPLAALNIEGVE
ncbi:MAG: hypothetical protein JWP25_8743 [Bradyrhizobium sp.]|jgi:uncharacterized protein YndB with AHSA1/START domain|nr:hypothetical protein [Bradyrhizobium sp.]MEA2866361.1 hypothetical protein [Bradyrhizobium sp.]